DLEGGAPRDWRASMLQIPQLVAPGTLEEKALLPSFLYLPAPEEFPPESLALPWSRQNPGGIVGELARSHGAKVPTRLVASAKSWLSYTAVDRMSALLPWQAPPDVTRVSPVEASARYLGHLAAAWDHAHAGRGKSQAPMRTQEIVLTVPASFDAAASDLTLKAAEQAGLENVTLLEEPQAALYAWLEVAGEGFRKLLKKGDVILVVDVGGGTTDFSLIAVAEENGELQLTRLAVGDHILLGGDNMDLALAHTLQQQLNTAGKKLDSWQFISLVHGCRKAKESLFGDAALKKTPISVPGRGSGLVGGTIKTELTRELLTQVLTDGFFPETRFDQAPSTARRTGLAQIGLPYAQDPAITRHLAAFLTRQARALEQAPEAPAGVKRGAFVHPTAILFNGGVFKAGTLKDRLVQVLNTWLREDGGQPVRELQGADLDLAVARGAAYYGWTRHGHGIRIRG
ncbi:Hsp70 family protein, partial [bacterium]|nr:Hsp70 family protein [bacterium]